MEHCSNAAAFPQASFVAIEPLLEHNPKPSSDCKRKRAIVRLRTLRRRQTERAPAAKVHVSNDLDGSTVGGSGGELHSVPLKSIRCHRRGEDQRTSTLPEVRYARFELPILRGREKTLNETNVIIMVVY